MGSNKITRLSSDLDLHFTYSNLNGFFMQDESSTDPDSFDYATTNMGLLNRSYPTDEAFDPEKRKTQWERFANYVLYLNKMAKNGECYKVLYLGRHGEGYHNVAEAAVGTPMWDCYWSKLEGNDKIVWDNAELTPKGVSQALQVNGFWQKALTHSRIPAPESYYVSPLQRCLSTSNYTFSGLDLPLDKPFKPVIKELLREALGVHTCDRRYSKSKIVSMWPEYVFEPNFVEDDPLWDPEYRESWTHEVFRLQLLLDDIFSADNNVFISFSSHSGAISAILHGIGHRSFQLQTGAVIPVFVKGQAHETPRPVKGIDPPTKAPTCSPPAAS